MKQYNSISKEKLAILTNRVTKAIPVLETLDSNTMWEHPMEQFYKVVNNPPLIDTIILEEKKDSSIISGNTRKSHASLACIYILLYFFKRDNNYYKQFVFPEIAKNMGVFGSNYLNRINEKIDNVLLMDNALKDVEEENKKNAKPLFRLPELSEVESDELEREFSRESLYRKITPLIDTLGLDNHFYPNMPQLWKAAKEIMLFLCNEEYPYHYVPKILAKIDKQYGVLGDIHGQLLMLCIYAMLRSVKDSLKLSHVIFKIEEYKNNNITKYTVLKMSITALKDAFDDPNIKWFDGYDYTQGQQESNDMINALDSISSDKLEAMQKLLDQKNDELNMQKDKYEKQINELSLEVEKLKDKISEIPSPGLKLKVGDERKTDFIKVLYTLVRLKVITKEDNTEVTVKDAMKAFGTLLSDKTIANYSSALTEANNTSDLNYYKFLDEMRNVLEKYREDSQKRKKNK